MQLRRMLKQEDLDQVVLVLQYLLFVHLVQVSIIFQVQLVYYRKWKKKGLCLFLRKYFYLYLFDQTALHYWMKMVLQTEDFVYHCCFQIRFLITSSASPQKSNHPFQLQVLGLPNYEELKKLIYFGHQVAQANLLHLLYLQTVPQSSKIVRKPMCRHVVKTMMTQDLRQPIYLFFADRCLQFYCYC